MMPPENSKISNATDRNGYPVLTLPPQKGSPFRYAICAFLIFWLCGWAVGWVGAATALFVAKDGVQFFLLFWLCAWTVGGGFAIWQLRRMLRRAIPETLTFTNPGLIYDSGVQPFQMSFGFGYRSQM